MEKIVCLFHPKYDGKENPDLRCASCCSIFVLRIKQLNTKRAQDVAAWLESKSAVRRQAGSK